MHDELKASMSARPLQCLGAASCNRWPQIRGAPGGWQKGWVQSLGPLRKSTGGGPSQQTQGSGVSLKDSKEGEFPWKLEREQGPLQGRALCRPTVGICAATL